MAEAASPAVAEAKAKPGLMKRLLVPVVVLLVGVGAGAGGTYYLEPMLAPLAEPGQKKPPAPKLAPLEYVEIENSFTSNLRDTDRFMQVKIAVSTQGGAPVVEAVKRHQVAIIAAVLGVLAETGQQELSAAGGREALTTRMRLVINDVLQRKSGVAGIDDVFLTSFVMQ